MIGLDRLPPFARAKFRALEQAANDAEALARSVYSQIAAANHRLPSRLNLRDTASNEIEATTAQREIDEIEAELTRLQSVQRLRNSLAASHRQTVLAVGAWLQQQSPAARFAAASAIKATGELGSLEAVRESIARLKAQLAEIELAPLSADDLKAQARELVDRLAQRGAPVLNLSRGGFDVRWRSRTDAGTTAMNSEDVISTLAWLNRDAVTAALEAQIDRTLADIQSTPLSLSEREKRKQEIAAELLAAERTEEALIETMPDVPRRPDADPRAVLGIEIIREAAQAA